MTDFRFGKDRSCSVILELTITMGKKNDDEYLNPPLPEEIALWSQHLLFNWIDIPYLNLVEMLLPMPCHEN